MARPTVSLVTALLLFSPLNWAYEVPLASRSVRDAYFLGQRNNEDTDAFLETYTRRFAVPPQGPYISEIRLLTHYAQAVDLSRHKTLGYSAQQAEAEYKTPGDSLLVRVRIDFTPTYNDVMRVKPTKDDGSQPNIAQRPEDFWIDFRFLLTQNDEPVQSELVPRPLPTAMLEGKHVQTYHLASVGIDGCRIRRAVYFHRDRVTIALGRHGQLPTR